MWRRKHRKEEMEMEKDNEMEKMNKTKEMEMEMQKKRSWRQTDTQRAGLQSNKKVRTVTKVSD